jgi:twinkle protein
MSIVIDMKTARHLEGTRMSWDSGYGHDGAKADILRGTRAFGPTLPWPRTHDTVRFKPKEVTFWAGKTGHGKTTMLSHAIVELLHQGIEVMFFNLEMDPQALSAMLYQQIAGTASPSPLFMDSVASWLDGRLFLRTHRGAIEVAHVLDEAAAFLSGDIHRHVVIDNISYVDFGAEREETSAKRFMAELTRLAARYDAHIHVVGHCRKGTDRHGIPALDDVAGTRFWTTGVDNGLIVWRNLPKRIEQDRDPEEVAQMTERELQARERRLAQSDTLLLLEKNRGIGPTGSFGLWFDPESRQFLSQEGARPIRYTMGGTAF